MSDSNATVAEPQHPSQARQWILATLAGLAVAVPVSVILSFAGLLPMYLGPFFFLLFGLGVGAAIFRVARHARPAPKSLVIACPVIVILVTFLATMTLEYEQLGPHAARMAAKRTRALPPGLSLTDFQAAVIVTAERQIAEGFPPGGVFGYLRWAATNGRMVLESEQARPPFVTYVISQSNLGFTLRVLFSLILLAGGIFSQVLPLRKPASPDSTQQIATQSEGRDPQTLLPSEDAHNRSRSALAG